MTFTCEQVAGPQEARPSWEGLRELRGSFPERTDRSLVRVTSGDGLGPCGAVLDPLPGAPTPKPVSRLGRFSVGLWPLQGLPRGDLGPSGFPSSDARGTHPCPALSLRTPHLPPKRPLEPAPQFSFSVPLERLLLLLGPMNPRRPAVLEAGRATWGPGAAPLLPALVGTRSPHLCQLLDSPGVLGSWPLLPPSRTQRGVPPSPASPSIGTLEILSASLGKFSTVHPSQSP